MKRILLDQNIPRTLMGGLTKYQVETAFGRGWSSLSNGDLIDAAEAAGFDVMITADRNLEYQQNLTERRLAIIVLDTNRWPLIRSHVGSIMSAIDKASAGSFIKVDCF